nr:serine protease [Rhodovibrio salinarum]
MNVDRRYIRNIRAALFSVEKLGIESAEKKYHEEYGGRSSLAQHLRGKISFVAQVKGSSDPVVRGLAVRFNRCFPDWPIKVSPTQRQIWDRAIWVIENEDTQHQGTAFFLKDIGLVTAAHCVEKTDMVKIFHPSNPTNIFQAKVIRRHKYRDLALLENTIPDAEYYELVFNSYEIDIRQEVIALGYPTWWYGEKINVRTGHVTATIARSLDQVQIPGFVDVQLIEVTQSLADGMSGGPLVDGDGAVIGVIHKGGTKEERNLAIDIRELEAWLNKDESEE